MSKIFRTIDKHKFLKESAFDDLLNDDELIDNTEEKNDNYQIIHYDNTSFNSRTHVFEFLPLERNSDWANFSHWNAGLGGSKWIDILKENYSNCKDNIITKYIKNAVFCVIPEKLSEDYSKQRFEEVKNGNIKDNLPIEFEQFLNEYADYRNVANIRSFVLLFDVDNTQTDIKYYYNAVLEACSTLWRYIKKTHIRIAYKSISKNAYGFIYGRTYHMENEKNGNYVHANEQISENRSFYIYNDARREVIKINILHLLKYVKQELDGIYEYILKDLLLPAINYLSNDMFTNEDIVEYYKEYEQDNNIPYDIKEYLSSNLKHIELAEVCNNWKFIKNRKNIEIIIPENITCEFYDMSLGGLKQHTKSKNLELTVDGTVYVYNIAELEDICNYLKANYKHNTIIFGRVLITPQILRYLLHNPKNAYFKNIDLRMAKFSKSDILIDMNNPAVKNKDAEILFADNQLTILK